MISRRPYARHNRGRVAAITPAPSATIQIPLAGTWDGGYWDSEDGPVDVGSGKVDPWVPLEGATNLSQSSSGDRGTLTTDYFGGANAVLFNGTNERMIANALASIAAGTTSFTLALNVHVLTVATNDALAAFGNDSVVGAPYHILRTNSSTGASWEVARDGDSGADVVRSGGTTSTGVHRLIMSFSSAGTITLWDNGTKVIDAAMVTNAPSLTNFAIACRIISTAGLFMHGAYKNVAVRSGTISDGDAATLNTAWGG